MYYLCRISYKVIANLTTQVDILRCKIVPKI